MGVLGELCLRGGVFKTGVLNMELDGRDRCDEGVVNPDITLKGDRLIDRGGEV
jgi:hypothetical protein